MHSQIAVIFHGVDRRGSCGHCDRCIGFDHRMAAVVAAREHRASHHRGAIWEIVVLEGAGG